MTAALAGVPARGVFLPVQIGFHELFHGGGCGAISRTALSAMATDVPLEFESLLAWRRDASTGRSLWYFLEPNEGESLEGKPIEGWPLLLLEHPVRGRYVVAARDLGVGELVCAEEPFVHTVHDDLQSTVCHHCFSLLASEASAQVESCRACCQVRYCSATCARDGAAVHAAECDVLQAIIKSGNPALQKGVRGLRLFVRLVHRAAADPRAFADVEALVEHYTDAPPERRRMLEGIATQVNKIVPPHVRMPLDRLAKAVSRVHTNSHAIADMAGLQYGSGLYAKVGSYFNHSCAPSAVSSFRGRTWRLHTIRPVRRGDEVSISYTEMYASRDERQASLKAQKGFKCACARCVAPPARDLVLDGWRCSAPGCEGVLGAAQTTCTRCHTAHALPPATRTSIEQRWVASIDEGAAGLRGGRGGASFVSSGSASSAVASTAAVRAREVAACEAAMCAAEKVLLQSEAKLHPHHALRNKARRLKVYALPPDKTPADLVRALEDCLPGLRAHLPHGHPETAFFEHWLAHALCDDAASYPAGSSARERLRQQARHVANAALDGLTISYGADHPFVHTWRASDAERDRALAG